MRVFFLLITTYIIGLVAARKPRFETEHNLDKSIVPQEAYEINPNAEPDQEIFKNQLSTKPFEYLEEDDRGEGILEGLVKIFVDRLKSFVSDFSFDVAQFKLAIDDLEKELRDLSDWATTLRISRKLSKQLQFAQMMFLVMISSKALLNKYSHLNVPGNRLIYKMTELNVRTLALHDTNGVLDLRTHKAVERVYALTESLHLWGQRFHSLIGVPDEMIMEFNTQMKYAENLLIYLRS